MALAAILLIGNVRVAVADVPTVLQITDISQGSEAKIRLEIDHDEAPPYPNNVHYIDNIEVRVIGRAIMEFKLQTQNSTPFTVELDLGQLQGTPMVTARAHCTLHGYSAWSEAVTVGRSPPSVAYTPYVIVVVAILLVGASWVFALRRRRRESASRKA